MSELSHEHAEALKNANNEQNTTGGSTTSGNGSYAQIGESDVTAVHDDLQNGIEIQEEEKVAHDSDSDDDSDEIDKEISKLEQTMDEDEDEDTDED